NFSDRFERFPVKLGMLSRFVSQKEQKQVLKELQEGAIDMVIGTHRLLQKDVHFKNIGLMVVDEEQRFGVKDKERLKEIKTNVDSLTLTATPIPRTLHMSLLKIRDMSVLKTAPHNRLPIETIVQEFNEELVAQAIQKEIDRGGQIYFLHNRVETLESVRTFLERVVPEVMVETAHGQMGPQELEDIMHRFIHGGFHVLVATTIIENGIDIPNVNTIIIDRADMYGISQLYQLRGRVGRSGKLAYAYLFYPGQRALSEIAMKRLQVISDYTELGSGFKIALKDLEVRGAGNLLGPQQSGDILSVGFDLYLKLLDEAIRRLEDTGDEGPPEVYLELEYTGFIPDSYISEPIEKMEVYKRIASITTDEELDSVYAALEDRFGPMPDEVQSLLSLAEIRIICQRLHISSIRERKGRLEVEFARVASVSVDKLLKMIETGGKSVLLDPRRPNVLFMNTTSVGLKEKSEFIRGRLSALV
ncbi:MAG TPA: TRCF domain-containing protein, partial [Spirochaetia bacterium]|nr:TRCF domain-containing protein [Spirochaetia bacterium]